MGGVSREADAGAGDAVPCSERRQTGPGGGRAPETPGRASRRAGSVSAGGAERIQRPVYRAQNDGRQPAQTQEQKEWLGRLRLEDYKAEICVGWMDAVKTICLYLGIAPPDIIQ